MKKIACLILMSSLSLAVVADDECGAMVDMADSYDFHKMHIECAKDPIVIYDPSSKEGLLHGKKKAVTTYEQPVSNGELSSAAVTTTGTDSIAVVDKNANAGQVFNIRELFVRANGPQSAINGLFGQMLTYCPNGFEKLKEWVVPAPKEYYLHYQFQCAE